MDKEGGLYYNLNRYYDPGVGRYLTADPIKLFSGLNQYQHCENPISWIDPLGLLAGLESNSSTGHAARQQLEEMHGKGANAADVLPNPYGITQSRINIMKGSQANGAGWNHVIHEHYSGKLGKSQLTLQ